VSDDVATDAGRDRRAELRRRRITLAGHRGDATAARRGLADPDLGVQAAALGALARTGDLTTDDVLRALESGPAPLRRRAVDASVSVRGKGSRSVLPGAISGALDDPDPLVVVAAAWFVGERRYRPAVPGLVQVAAGHDDPRCREAAVAALGAIGEPDGLSAVLAALSDRPTVRRRATVALAGFDDPRVEPALRQAAADRDWQVRQAAEELLDDTADVNGDGSASEGRDQSGAASEETAEPV
jgi:HEAT repeat protein